MASLPPSAVKDPPTDQSAASFTACLEMAV